MLKKKFLNVYKKNNEILKKLEYELNEGYSSAKDLYAFEPEGDYSFYENLLLDLKDLFIDLNDKEFKIKYERTGYLSKVGSKITLSLYISYYKSFDIKDIDYDLIKLYKYVKNLNDSILRLNLNLFYRTRPSKSVYLYLNKKGELIFDSQTSRIYDSIYYNLNHVKIDIPLN